jgi:hypothetical protein
MQFDMLMYDAVKQQAREAEAAAKQAYLVKQAMEAAAAEKESRNVAEPHSYLPWWRHWFRFRRLQVIRHGKSIA